MCFFSVIVPTYNSASVVGCSIQSIMEQTFSDHEVIVQDGGSQDGTLTAIESFRTTHPDKRFIIQSENDKGVYDAMNKAIKKARGEYLYFLGSDDALFESDVLEKVSRFIRQNNYPDMVYGNVYSPILGDRYDGEFNIKKIFDHNICHQAIFYKKSLVDRFCGYNSRYSVLADYDLNIRCFLAKDVEIKYVDLIIARFSQGGLSSTISEAQHIKERSSIITKYGWGVVPPLQIKLDYISSWQFYIDLLKYKLGIKKEQSPTS